MMVEMGDSMLMTLGVTENGSGWAVLVWSGVI